MGAEYSADVFFGVAFKSKTPTGKKLDKYIDAAGGAPAETEIAGVEIVSVGSSWSGDTWLVARAVGSGHSYDRSDDVVAPVMLTEDPTWRPALAAFFAHLKIKDPPAVGWHFAGSVS